MELVEQGLAEVRPFIDMDVCHMYMNYPANLLEPRVIDTIEFPAVFKSQESVQQWDDAMDHVERELALIKNLPITQIPDALVELFSVYATKESLGDQFEGDETGMIHSDTTGPNRGMGLDRRFIRIAMDQVFNQVGYGSYSVAYRLCDDWIVKINCADDDYTYGDDGGFDWAKACTSIQSNIFVPKIGALYQKDRLYAVVVECLEENNGMKSPDTGCLRDLAESWHPELNFGEYISEFMNYETFVLMAAIHRDDLIEVAKVFDTVAMLTQSPDDLTDFNVMVRGKIPVLNDPFGTSVSHSLVTGKSFAWTM